ncbi:MAG: hypothetical protein JWL89_90 [Candidatus Saccharibacteria bacterium]|nr:hypothetical protein [Candidatus Saccharibacteria bacterium]
MSDTKSKNISTMVILIVVGAVVLGGLSFLAGTAYQKHAGGTASAQPAAGLAGRGGFGGGQRMNGSLGSVTAVSDTSITLDDQRSNASKTYTIDSPTAVTNNGATAAVTDIKVGDTVLVSSGSATSTTATRILLNPSFGGGPQGG